jgi:Ca2+-binding RTX toxin-like protein
MELAVLMNNKAPGTTLLSELVAKSAAGSSLTEIAEHLAGRAEFKAAYPTFQTATEFATEWLGNALPEASAALLAECVTIVEAHINGGGSIPALVVSIQAFMTDPANADGAVKTHIDNFSNKVTVATYHTITKEAAAEWEIPASVTSDASTISTANAAVDTATAPAAAASQTKSLTVGVDNIVGGSGDDLILGTIDETVAANNTFGTADNLSGGEGTDTLQIAVSNVAAPRTYTPALITDVEQIRVVNTDAVDLVTLNATSVAGLTSVEASSSSQGIDITNITSTTTKLVSTANTGTGGSGSNFTFKAAALVGASTDIDLTLTSTSGDVTVQTTGAGIESATITAVGVNTGGSYIGAATDLETLTVKGTGSLVVAAADMTALKTLDATGNSGGVTYDASVATGATLKGGSGNDTLTDGGGNDVVTGGAGNDTLAGGTGNDNIDGGAGDDTVTLANAAGTPITANDTIVGGEGTDTLALGVGTTYSATVSAGSGISGFEVLQNDAGASITQNMSGLGTNAITTLSLGGGTGTATVQEAAITTVNTEDMGATGGATLGLKTDGAADTLAVNIGAAGGTRGLTLAAMDYETLNIASTGTDGNSVSLADTEASYLATTAAEIAARTAAATARTATDLTTITITGNKNLTVTDSAKSTALATVNAVDFTGSTLVVTANDSNAAMTVTANTATSATITTGDGADTVTVGDGGAALTNSITTGKGNDIVTSGAGADIINVGTGSTAGANNVTSGAGIDNITAGDGADIIDGGAGNDIITSAKGADSITAGDGDDTVTTTDGNDTVIGGTGNDIITTNKGADSIVAGDGNDVMTTGSGSDYADGGAGNDTFTMGVGDDTVVGGAGNDAITLTSLTNGDNIDGGADTDTLTLTSIASSVTPKNIVGIEKLTATTLGGGASAITVNLTNVSDLTTLTATENSNSVTMTLSNLPSTLTTINLADSSSGDTLAASYSTGPTSLTLNSYGLANAATNITSLNAPLTITNKIGTTLAGTAQGYAVANITALGTMSTDATGITISTEAAAAEAASTANIEFAMSNVTDAVLETYSVTSGANTDTVIGTGGNLTNGAGVLTTTNTEFTSATINVGGGAGVNFSHGEIVANSATAVSYSLTTGAQAAVVIGDAANTFNAADVTVSGTIGDQSTLSHQKIVGNDIVSNTWTVGAGVAATMTLPAVEVDAASGTIGATSITTGIASTVSQAIGSTTTPLTIGTISLNGSGTVTVTPGATAGATNTAGTAPAQGAISAAGMTSALSSAVINAAAAVSTVTITGGGGNDTITLGTLGDTVTPGGGADTIVNKAAGGTDVNRIILNPGDSAPVAGAVNASTGQDIIHNLSAAGNDKIVVTGTSIDQSWVHTTHVLMGLAGTGTGAATAVFGDPDSYTVKTGIVTFKAALASAVADVADYAFMASTNTGAAGANNSTLQAAVEVNLTGSSGDDTLTMGANNDTVSGGLGVDTILGNAGGDVIDGGAGNDILDYNALGDSIGAGGATSPITYDTVTLGISTTNKDSIDIAGVASTQVVDANSVVPQAVSLSGSTETTVTLFTAAIEAAITGTANEVSLIKVSDTATDTSADGNFSGYYMVVNDTTAAIGASDLLIKLVGIADTSVLSETGTDIFQIT